jgi:hypothetical protein
LFFQISDAVAWRASRMPIVITALTTGGRVRTHRKTATSRNRPIRAAKTSATKIETAVATHSGQSGCEIP